MKQTKKTTTKKTKKTVKEQIQEINETLTPVQKLTEMMERFTSELQREGYKNGVISCESNGMALGGHFGSPITSLGLAVTLVETLKKQQE